MTMYNIIFSLIHPADVVLSIITQRLHLETVVASFLMTSTTSTNTRQTINILLITVQQLRLPHVSMP